MLTFNTQHEQDEDQTDVWFTPYRRPQTTKARRLIDGVAREVEAHEQKTQPRKRRRRLADQQTFEDTILAVVSDAIYNHLRHPEARVSITRSNKVLGTRSRYRPRTYGKTLPRLLDCLSSPSLGYLDQQLGWSSYDTGGDPRQTTIRATERLRVLVAEAELGLDDFTTVDHPETIILKRTKEDFWDKGGEHEYTDSANTRRYRNELATINQWLHQAVIDIDTSTGGKLAQVDPRERSMRRIFTNGRFDSGGRLFGGFCQELGKRQRLEGVFIDEQPVVELDYAQMAPRIIYGMAGADLPDGDLYSLPTLGGGHEVLERQYRPGIKKLFNAMLFAATRLTKKPKGTAKLLPKNRSITELMDMIIAAHPAIKDAFFKGMGHDAQFVESQIMVAVLLELTERGIVALPVHDALIVACGDADVAEQVMLETFRKHAGVPAEITRMEG